MRRFLALPSSSLSSSSSSPIRGPHSRLFSTTPSPSTNNTNANPSYPSLSHKSISPNPRVRMALVAGLLVMAAGETYMWIRFWPQITGKRKEEGSSSEGSSS
ncbi:hypothetical protein MMYC01_208351 [Madurella mycetomatis]|uniref:Uncharacterized protein n=1 Tax=Madurella mycetomatis TaxID=100816 RepID=A0A175VUC4_9PEZI|nr:hypothetical protein MMYC01_208351 [Madurella mycetomatis]